MYYGIPLGPCWISAWLFHIYLYKKIDFKWNKAEPFFKYSVKKKQKNFRLKISNMFWFHIQQQLNNLNGVEKAKYIVEILVIRTQRQPD